MPPIYKYIAFISYKHTDIKWAKRLQFFLEAYRLPTSLVRDRPTLPKRFNVFRDVTELTSGILSEELRKKLDESKYLIVICSPHSARSEYVGEEIAYFRSCGRDRDIIPFIVSGVPHAGLPDKECFHPQLTLDGLELLGIDLQAEDSHWLPIRFQKAFIRLVARLLDLDYGVLWNRRKHNLIKLATASAALLTTLVALLIFGIKERPFDAAIRFALSDHAQFRLPLSGDLSDSLSICFAAGDCHSYVVTHIDSSFTMPHIPGSLRNKDVHIECHIFGFYPLDTVMPVRPKIIIPLRRDPEVYGRIRLIAIDDDSSLPLGNVLFDLGFMTGSTDSLGRLDLFVPLEHQAAAYPAHISSDDKIYHSASPIAGDSIFPYVNRRQAYALYLKHE